MVAQTKSMQLYVYKERYHMRPSVITTNEEKGKRLKERIIIIRPSNSDRFTSHGLGYVALAASGRRFRIMCGTCNFDGLGLQLFRYQIVALLLHRYLGLSGSRGFSNRCLCHRLNGLRG